MTSKTTKKGFASSRGKSGHNAPKSNTSDSNVSNVVYNYSFQTAEGGNVNDNNVLEIPTPIVDNRKKQITRNENNSNQKIHDDENDLTLDIQTSFSNKNYMPNKYATSGIATGNSHIKNNYNNNNNNTATIEQNSSHRKHQHSSGGESKRSDSFKVVTETRSICEGYRAGIRWIIQSDTPGGHWMTPIKIVKGLETLQNDDDDDNGNDITQVERKSAPKMTQDKKIETTKMESFIVCPEKGTKNTRTGVNDKANNEQGESRTQSKSKVEIDGERKRQSHSKIASTKGTSDRDQRRLKKQEAQAKRPILTRQLSGQSLSNYVETSILCHQNNEVDHIQPVSNVFLQSEQNNTKSIESDKPKHGTKNGAESTRHDKYSQDLPESERKASKEDQKERVGTSTGRSRSTKDVKEGKVELRQHRSRSRVKEPKATCDDLERKSRHHTDVQRSDSKIKSESDDIRVQVNDRRHDKGGLKQPPKINKSNSNNDKTSKDAKSNKTGKIPVMDMKSFSDSVISEDMSIDPLNGFVPHQTRQGVKRPTKQNEQEGKVQHDESRIDSYQLKEISSNSNPNDGKLSSKRTSSPKRRSNSKDDEHRQRKNPNPSETKVRDLPVDSITPSLKTYTTSEKSLIKSPLVLAKRKSDSLDGKSEHTSLSTKYKSNSKTTGTSSSLDSKSDHQASYHPSGMLLYPKKLIPSKDKVVDVPNEVKDVNNSSTYHSSTSSGEVSDVFSIGLGIQYLNQDDDVRAQKQKAAASCDMSFAQLNFTVASSDHQPGGVKFVDNDEVAAAADIEVEACEGNFVKTTKYIHDTSHNQDESESDTHDKPAVNGSIVNSGAKKDSVVDSPVVGRGGTTIRSKSFFSSKSKNNTGDESAGISPKRVNRSFSLIRPSKVESTEEAQCESYNKDSKGKDKNSNFKRFLSFGHASNDIDTKSLSLLDDNDDDE